jgi:hypothetical protein
MVYMLSKRRTHYEVLGLTPAATSEEIERAFARQFGCFQPHTVGRLADVTVAYEALRNPAKRRAYDASLGLKPEEAPRQSQMTWRIGGQVMTAKATPAMRPAIDWPAIRPTIERAVLAEPQVNPKPVEATNPEVTPVIGASPFAAILDELASPEPLAKRSETQAKPQVEPRQPEAEPARAVRSGEERRVDLALNDVPGNAEEGGIPWKQAGIVLGAVTAAVALLGAWAGWESVSSAEPAENKAQATLPPPTTYTVADPAAAVPDRVLDATRPLPRKRAARAETRTVRARPTSRLADLEQQLARPAPAPLEVAASTSAPTEAPPAVAASLPLPNRVVARTLQRIGYPCGQIASTTQSETPGVFKVTCTSGHSYQAAPVRGRYHFRRLSGG